MSATQILAWTVPPSIAVVAWAAAWAWTKTVWTKTYEDGER